MKGEINLEHRISKCPCCENYTLNHDIYGHYGEICEVCLWQSDEIQDNNPDVKEGLNPISLNEAKENYKKIGAIIEKYVKYTRKPKEWEIPKITYYDKVGNELFDKHSLAALIILISIGDELDFHYKNISYGISWLNEKVLLSSPEEEKDQKFDNIKDLILYSTIGGNPFIDAWDDLILDFLW